MSIVVFAPEKRALIWANAMKSQLPQECIEVYPEVENYEAIDYAVAWLPEPDVFAQFPNLKVVQSLGAGVDHIFNTQSIAEGLQITRIVDQALAKDMFEYVLTGIMNWMKGFGNFTRDQQRKVWNPLPYRRIKNTRVAIWGLGEIGSVIATELVKLGFDVQGWSRTQKAIIGVTGFSGQSGMLDSLSGCDVLINVLPLTQATEGILNAKNLSYLNDGAYLINVGRGGHLQESDLSRLIESGRLSGALLDVFNLEPLPSNHTFWHLDGLTITPHIAAITDQESAISQIVENYQRFRKNMPLLHPVELKKGY